MNWKSYLQALRHQPVILKESIFIISARSKQDAFFL